MDARLKRLRLKVLSRRYHIPATINGFGLAVIDAYNIYRDLADGNYGDEYKLEKPLSQEDWVMTASKEGMLYTTTDFMYPGDVLTKSYMRTPKKRKKNTNTPKASTATNTSSGVKRKIYALAEEKRQRHRNALVYNMNEFESHVPRVNSSWSMQCQFCGGKTYWQCSKCEVFLCAPRDVSKGKTSRNQKCHYRYHNPLLLGMAYCDHHEDRTNWKYDNSKIENMLRKNKR